MNTNAGRVVYKVVGCLTTLYAITVLLLYLFDGNIGGILRYQAMTAGVLCVFLCYTVLINSTSLIRQPFTAYVVVGFYMIICLLLCFPNRYMDDFALLYLIAIPLACYYGFRYALVGIFAVMLISVFDGGIETADLLHSGYALIAAVAASGKLVKGTDLLLGFIAFLLQGILLLLSGRNIVSDSVVFIKEIAVIILNSLTIPVVYRLSIITEKAVSTAEEVRPEQVVQELLCDSIEPAAFTGATTQVETEKIPSYDGNEYPFTISYLISEECSVLNSMRECAPRAFERALEIATFARRMAYKFGANSDLVYAAALYHDVERIYKGEPGAKVVLPEYLYTMVKRQNDKQPPISMEEMIVLLSNHVLAIYHYMEKNNSTISISKVIENIFNLQLKKGSIMSVGISMSVYHKMKQEFTNEFMIYLENKREKK